MVCDLGNIKRLIFERELIVLLVSHVSVVAFSLKNACGANGIKYDNFFCESPSYSCRYVPINYQLIKKNKSPTLPFVT